MQWKHIFVAITLLSPISLSAQGPSIVHDGVALAMIDERTANDKVKEETNAKATSEVLIASGSRVVSPDSLIMPRAMPFKTAGEEAGKKKSPADAGQLLAARMNSNPLETERIKTPGFKHVPLIGELEYYGKMNNYMVDYCKSYMSNFSRRLSSVSTKEKTFAVMEEILAKHGIPKELKYLAVIESALNGNARSPVGAVGFWQFMAPTAREMGLVVNRHRDERRDLRKSTHAAAKYLSYLYGQLDDWLLVIAAYNSGPRPVLNGIKRTGKKDFWAIKKYLPRETQNHVLAFVATATIMERLNDYIEPGLPSNFDWNSLNNTGGSVASAKSFEHPLLSKFSEEEVRKMALVRIDKPLKLEVVAQALNVEHKLLGRWNYDYYEYLDTYQTGKTYSFRIPKEKLDRFLELKSSLERSSNKN